MNLYTVTVTYATNLILNLNSNLIRRYFLLILKFDKIWQIILCPDVIRLCLCHERSLTTQKPTPTSSNH